MTASAPPPHRLSQSALAALVCPCCRHPLDAATWSCPGCGVRYPVDEAGQPDLRLPAPQKVSLQIEVGTAPPLLPGAALAPLPLNPAPEVDFSHLGVPHHLTPELLSYFPAARRPQALALDLGCGSGVHRGVCEHAGFDCVGLDFRSPAADLLGDAHALPFADGSFDLVLSLAVFEHLRHPWLAGSEVARVLAPGGRFLGTVAFLEPLHSQSYYHHTHLGTLASLTAGGLTVDRVAPMVRWNVLQAQAENSLFPGLPKLLSRALVAPLNALHRAWWWLLQRRYPDLDAAYRLRRTTGAFAFLARKPDAAP